MSLRVVCCFSLLTGPDGWQDSHHSVKQFIDALKGRLPSGYGYIRLFPGARPRRMDYLNAREAVSWFGEMAASIIEDELGASVAPVLIPIPDSKSVLDTACSRTRALAGAAAARLPHAVVHDALRFDQPMPSAHAEQGARDPRSLLHHLRIREPVSSGRAHVLVDDVVTTGSHLTGAAAFLRQQGAKVVLAVCGASADRLPRGDPFERVTREVPDRVAPAPAPRGWMYSVR
jgi:hypothetical protein